MSVARHSAALWFAKEPLKNALFELMEQTSLVISKERREGTEGGWLFCRLPWLPHQHNQMSKGSLLPGQHQAWREDSNHRPLFLLTSNYTREVEAVRVLSNVPAYGWLWGWILQFRQWLCPVRHHTPLMGHQQVWTLRQPQTQGDVVEQAVSAFGFSS